MATTLATGYLGIVFKHPTTSALPYLSTAFSYAISYSGGSTITVTVGCRFSEYTPAVMKVTYNGSSEALSLDAGTGISPYERSVTFTLDKSVTTVSFQVTKLGTQSYPSSTYWCYIEKYTSSWDWSDVRDSEQTVETISFSIPNNKPTATITVPELKAGKTARISWVTSDSDGDTVKATKLVRYYKASGETSYTQTTVYSSSSGTTTKYYDDTIPEDAVDGSIYYVLTITDGIANVTITSTTVDVTAGTVINGQGVIGGAAKELTAAYACIDGVWKEIVEAYVNIGGTWKPMS